ncbi:MAG TPA: asparagine synthase-related protein [Solirubrobacteraceae bacterium]|nr:asparagine synthase-related protein [Solirubrobacteraceae bacterium]
MTRRLAGVFDPSGRADRSRVALALAPQRARTVDLGPLLIAHDGPAANGGELLCLVDGQLDNARELADDLGAPPGSTEEQLLALAYECWGRGMLARLRGDFAVLLWDARHGAGLLARDQLGVGSIYLHEASGRLCFASELRDLLALLPTRPEPDRTGVAHWIAVSGRPGSGTLYAGVRRLNPGSVLLLDSSCTREERWWAPRFSEPLELPPPELARSVRDALTRAVSRRLDPDRHTAVLMSGGLDSAAVAALATEQAPGRIDAYTGVFPEHPLVDESSLIEELRATLRLSGVTAEVRPGGLLASAVEHQRAWETPLVAWGDFWTLPLLRAAAASGIRRTLGGDGGDELFGARSHLLADRLRTGRALRALTLALELPGAGDRPARREVARVFGELALAGALPYRVHSPLRRLRQGSEVPTWLTPASIRELRDAADPLAWKRLDGPRWWAHTAHGLTRGVEETGVFEHQRQRGALAGVQARHPLFDLDLLELGLRLAPEASFDRHRNRPILRASMAGLLPDSVRLRPAKAWFDSLIVDCLTGPDGAAVHALLCDPRAELRAYVELDGVREVLLQGDYERAGGPFRWMHQTWRLVTAECWLRAQADPGRDPLPRDLKLSAASVRLQTSSA